MKTVATTAASGASAADGDGSGWMEAAVADGGYRGGWRQPWQMGQPRRRMEATVAGRPRRMGWLVVVKGGRGGVTVADGGSSGGQRR